ncbi:MAG: ornithine carbamoyltransferase [bacterium]
MTGHKLEDFISISQLNFSQISAIFARATALKTSQKNDCPLIGKSLALIFRKPSMRTRVSFEVGMYQLGGHAVVLRMKDIGIGEREAIQDIGRTISRYVDGIVIRTFSHQEVLDLAKWATVPVINGLDDNEHPCQAMADLFTIQEKRGKLKGLKLAYIGDGNNVCNSLIQGCEKVEMEIVVSCPKGYEPEDISKIKDQKSKIRLAADPKEAVVDADIIYTDVWASMGEEKLAANKKKAFKGYQVNSALVNLAKADVLVMHCLPAHRGEEITDEVLEGKNSIVFDQAENRLHVQKAILVELMGR